MSTDPNYWGSGPSQSPMPQSPGPQPAPWGAPPPTPLTPQPQSPPWSPAGAPAPQPASWSPVGAPQPQLAPGSPVGPLSPQLAGQRAVPNAPQQAQWGPSPGQAPMAQPPYGYAAPGAYGAPPQHKSFPKAGVAAIVIAIVVLVIVAIVVTMQAVSKQGPTILTGKSVPWYDLKAGDCFDRKAFTGADNTDAYVVACTKEHDSEVFFSGKLPGVVYPSDAVVEAYLTENCDPAFKDYVGIDYTDSILDVRYVMPEASSWATSKHVMVCYALDTAGPRTSSIKGTAQ